MFNLEYHILSQLIKLMSPMKFQICIKECNVFNFFVDIELTMNYYNFSFLII